MDRPTLDSAQAVHQAGDTVHIYLHRAVAILDDCFGSGYAAANPALVAECIRSQSLDYHTTALTAVLYSLGDTVETAAGEVVRTIGETAARPG